jgi:hypothetical protein
MRSASASESGPGPPASPQIRHRHVRHRRAGGGPSATRWPADPVNTRRPPVLPIATSGPGWRTQGAVVEEHHSETVDDRVEPRARKPVHLCVARSKRTFSRPALRSLPGEGSRSRRSSGRCSARVTTICSPGLLAPADTVGRHPALEPAPGGPHDGGPHRRSPGIRARGDEPPPGGVGVSPRRRRANLVSALLLTTPACAVTASASVPRCEPSQRLGIVAQSVPGAAYLPCIAELPSRVEPRVLRGRRRWHALLVAVRSVGPAGGCRARGEL